MRNKDSPPIKKLKFFVGFFLVLILFLPTNQLVLAMLYPTKTELKTILPPLTEVKVNALTNEEAKTEIEKLKPELLNKITVINLNQTTNKSTVKSSDHRCQVELQINIKNSKININRRKKRFRYLGILNDNEENTLIEAVLQKIKGENTKYTNNNR